MRAPKLFLLRILVLVCIKKAVDCLEFEVPIVAELETRLNAAVYSAGYVLASGYSTIDRLVSFYNGIMKSTHT